MPQRTLWELIEWRAAEQSKVHRRRSPSRLAGVRGHQEWRGGAGQRRRPAVVDGATGIVQPRVGDPNDLLLQYLPANTPAQPGDYVVTSGTVASGDDSLYPPGIPIGQVTSVNEESAFRSVNVHPLADLHNLDVVQVLTTARRSLPANLSRLAASLPPGQSAGGGASAEQLASTEGGG